MLSTNITININLKSISNMSITPLHNNVLVKRIEAESKTSGGIIIPDTAKEKPAEGEVVSVGAGLRDNNGNKIALDVKAGDIVLFTKWGGTEIKFNGQEYLIVKETDILAIVNKK
jgi:chaperonin GroES